MVTRWQHRFLGRIDYQVKIRGFRIELEEVEGSLSSIEGIKQAIVVDKGEEGKNIFAVTIFRKKNTVQDILEMS